MQTGNLNIISLQTLYLLRARCVIAKMLPFARSAPVPRQSCYTNPQAVARHCRMQTTEYVYDFGSQLHFSVMPALPGRSCNFESVTRSNCTSLQIFVYMCVYVCVCVCVRHVSLGFSWMVFMCFVHSFRLCYTRCSLWKWVVCVCVMWRVDLWSWLNVKPEITLLSYTYTRIICGKALSCRMLACKHWFSFDFLRYALK